MATALPFHRAIVVDPAFTAEPFTVHTRWIETEFDNQIPPYAGAAPAAEEEEPRQTVVVEVGGKRLEVSLPGGFATAAPGATSGGTTPRRSTRKAAAAVTGDTLTSPMQGTIVKIAVQDGDTVAEGDLVVVLEAMKMEQPLSAHRSGTVKGLSAAVGEVVASGAVICSITD
jgi:acetyl-CoA/propionyl-CoA carboxylase biotin carboxyl carrier protein